MTGNHTVIKNARIVTLHRYRMQRGIALAISLVFLLMLTLLAVISMNTGTLQQKMAGNTRDMDIAFQSAESALTFGERTVSILNSAAGSSHVPCQNAVNGIWCFGTVDWTSLSWWLANSIPYMNDGAKQIDEAYDDPRVVIEFLAGEGLDGAVDIPADVATSGGKSGAKYYRVTARGVGVSGVSESVAESFYRVWKDQL